MRKITKIYWHCSGSKFGDDDEFGYWHRLRGFGASFRGQYTINTGYHFVILNGDISSGHGEELECLDGSIEVARRLEMVGAGVKGDNSESIHICLVGIKDFTDKQFESGIRLTKELMAKFGIPADHVYGHCEYWTRKGETPLKTCPNTDMDVVRQRLAA